MLEFKIVEEKDYPVFRQDIAKALSMAVIEEFGTFENDDDIIPESAINESLAQPNTEAYYIYENDKKVAGVVLVVNDETHHNSLDLFFVYPENHGKGIGYRIWQAIERKYPHTKIWTTETPYFEKRNIHFYVNKCGFKIVEFYNKHHQMPGEEGSEENHSKAPFKEDFFRFEKRMR